MANIDAIFVDGSHFTVEGDQTVEFTAGRKIQLIQGAGGVVIVASVSASYSAVTELTTVEVEPAAALSTLVSIELAQNETESVAVHDHTEQDQAGNIPAAHINQATVDELVALLAKSGIVAIASGAFTGISSATPGLALIVNPAGDGYLFGEIQGMPDPTYYGQLIRSTVPTGCVWQGDWHYDESPVYAVDDIVAHYETDQYVFYKCILSHMAAADKEPGVSAGWETYWEEADLEWEFFEDLTGGQFLKSIENGVPTWSMVDVEDIQAGIIPGEIGDLIFRSAASTKGFDVLPIGTPDIGAALTFTDDEFTPLEWKRSQQIVNSEKYASDPDLLIDAPVYMDPVTGKFRLATNLGTFQEADCCGIVTVPNVPGQVAIQVLCWGPHTFESDPSFTPGNRVYLGDGVIQDTEPVTGYTVILGRVEYGETDKIFFNPVYVEPTT